LLLAKNDGEWKTTLAMRHGVGVIWSKEGKREKKQKRHTRMKSLKE
jgi:hypothetical protein